MNDLKSRLARVELDLRQKRLNETAVAWRALLEQDKELLNFMMNFDLESRSESEQKEFFDFCIKRTFDRVDNLQVEPIPGKWLKAM